MNTFIEKNRNWLNFYANIARIIGWVLIILSAMPALLIPYIIAGAFHKYPGGITLMLGALLEVLFGRLPLGVIVLGTAQLIRYVSEKEYRPGWLLRHGSNILYIFAALMIIGSIVRYCYIYPSIKPVDILYIKMNLLPNTAVMSLLHK